MKLTINNYAEKWDSVKAQLPAYLVDNAEGYLEIADIIDAADDATRKDVQDFLDKCNKFIDKEGEQPKEQPKPKETKERKQREKKPKAPKAPKVPKEPKPKKEDTRIAVEDKSEAVKIITAFVKLHGKTVNVTTKDAARKLLNRWQKAAIEKRIRKSDEYAKELLDIQDSLIKISKLRDSEISIKGIEHYREIADRFKPMKPALLIKAYIRIQGKEDVKVKAKNLLKRVEDFLVKETDQNYREHVLAISRSLHDYLDDKSATPEMSEMQLNGLYGLAGMDCKPKAGHAINSREFLGATFNTLQFTGRWKTLIGMPENHFRIMIYGKPGSGKSTLALQFAHYLAKMGKKVLYVADEEKFGYTLQEKIKRLNCAHENLSIVDKIEASPKGLSKGEKAILYAPFDIIFLDSVSSMGLTAEDLRNFQPNKSFVYVFHTTKDGQFRGENTFSHDVDTVIKVEDMTANTEKNRFGASGTIRVLN
jgi:Fe-S cluster assembly ATPase SufC